MHVISTKVQNTQNSWAKFHPGLSINDSPNCFSKEKIIYGSYKILFRFSLEKNFLILNLQIKSVSLRLETKP